MSDPIIARFFEEKRRLVLAGEQVVDLSMFNPDIPPPRFALDCLLEATCIPRNHRYSVSRGTNKVLEAIVEKYSSTFGVGLLGVEQVCVTFGTKDALLNALKVTTNPEDLILLGTPTYPVYSSILNYLNLKTTTFRIDIGENQMLDDIESQVKTNRIKLILLNFPNNPTGVCVTNGFYTKLSQLQKKHNFIVVNDFVYGEMVYGKIRAVSSLDCNPDFSNCVEVYSLSKAYSLPGWRFGALVGDSNIVKRVAELKSQLDYGLFLPIQVAAAAVLKNKDSLSTSIVEEYSRRTSLVASSLRVAGWEVNTPAAGGVVWAKNNKQRSFDQFPIELLKTEKIAVTPGLLYGDEYKNWIRLAMTAKDTILKDVVDRIAKL